MLENDTKFRTYRKFNQKFFEIIEILNKIENLRKNCRIFRKIVKFPKKLSNLKKMSTFRVNCQILNEFIKAIKKSQILEKSCRSCTKLSNLIKIFNL